MTLVKGSVRRFGNIGSFPFLVPVPGWKKPVGQLGPMGILRYIGSPNGPVCIHLGGGRGPFHLTQVSIAQTRCLKVASTGSLVI